MATESGATIADDWHDVEDDNLSVVSIATSHTASDDTTIYPQSANTASFDDTCQEGDAGPAQQLPFRGKALKPIDTTSSNSFDPPAKGDQSADEDTGPPSPASAIADMLDCDVDPIFLLKVATSLLKLISEIRGAIAYQTKMEESEREALNDALAPLRTHIEAMVPLLKGYSRFWDPNMAMASLPLDPGLYEWMASLRIELLGLQAVVLGQLRLMSPTSSTASASDLSDFSKTKAALAGFSDQMDHFLPIMQCDFDDFFTLNLPLVSTEEYLDPPQAERNRSGRRSPSTTTTRPRPIPQAVGSPEHTASQHLFHLRRALYALKDTIADCITELQNFKMHVATPEDTQTLDDLIDGMYRPLRQTMDGLLSNHASDWIESSLAGGMTHRQFEAIDQEVVRSAHRRLREVVDNLRLEIGRFWAAAEEPEERDAGDGDDASSAAEEGRAPWWNTRDEHDLRYVHKVLSGVFMLEGVQRQDTSDES